jgi:Putative beta barrel porin-7 (BBP7)
LRKFALLFAALALSGTVFAADLPLATKAPSATRDYGSQYWVEADFLGWTVTGDKLPALVTTSPLGTPAPFAGVLGAVRRH